MDNDDYCDEYPNPAGCYAMGKCAMPAAKEEAEARRSAAACSASSILRLTLKRKWFDMIASGKKMEEYRDPSPWIYSRLLQKDGYTHRQYDVIEFKNGYGPNVPTLTVEFKGWKHGLGMPKWGATPGLRYVVILLGRVLSLHNVKGMAAGSAAPPLKSD